MAHYVLVPPRVWQAFIAWYGDSFAIPRFVIKYLDEGVDENLLKNNPLMAKRDKFIYELEVDEIFIRYNKYMEDGNKPAVMSEITLSKKKTFEECLFLFCHKLKIQEIHLCRLWQDDEIIIEQYLGASLEQAGISRETQMLVERQQEN
mmetsp:Transcript_23238/g.22808  ORF Transcript_23238/g.22808 Transcript_23238/m.22808 type:complete len:148 (+) Transcript_23238:256-699(+)